MSGWEQYLADKEPSVFKKKKRSKHQCKKNKIRKNVYGSCQFNDRDVCMHCSRPRKKILRLDPVNNTVIVEYLE